MNQEMTNDVVVECGGFRCKLYKGNYLNGRLGLLLMTEESEPYGYLTTNLPRKALGPDEFFVRAYDGNEEIARVMFQTGLFEDSGRKEHVGFVVVPVWRFKDRSLMDWLPRIA